MSSDLSSVSSPHPFHASLGRRPSPPLCEYEEFHTPTRESDSSGTPNEIGILSQNPYGLALDVNNPWQELLEVKQLISNKLILQDVATDQTGKAQSWLRHVDDMVRIAINSRKRRQFSSLFSWWQNREVHKLKESITTLVSRGKVLIDALSDTFIGHEDTLSQVGHHIGWEGISSNIIGIEGRSGIGKTGILQEFLEKNRSKIDFNAVIWLTISDGIRTFWIHHDIAKQLDLALMNCIGEERRRMMLYNALSSKKFLLVLDDLRGVLDLEAIGIPRPTTGSTSKIVIASRSEEVCRGMRVDVMIHVPVLTRQQSWELFRKAGSNDSIKDPEVEELARKLVSGCGGLPSDIVGCAKAMKNVQSIDEWRHYCNNPHLLRKFRLRSHDEVTDEVNVARNGIIDAGGGRFYLLEE